MHIEWAVPCLPPAWYLTGYRQRKCALKELFWGNGEGHGVEWAHRPALEEEERMGKKDMGKVSGGMAYCFTSSHNLLYDTNSGFIRRSTFSSIHPMWSYLN